MQWLHCVSAYFRGWPVFLVFSNIFWLIFESTYFRRSANFWGNTIFLEITYNYSKILEQAFGGFLRPLVCNFINKSIHFTSILWAFYIFMNTYLKETLLAKKAGRETTSMRKFYIWSKCKEMNKHAGIDKPITFFLKEQSSNEIQYNCFS